MHRRGRVYTIRRALRVCCALGLFAQQARADGGELAVEANYAANLTLLRAADAPYLGSPKLTRYDHQVAVWGHYGLHNRVNMDLGLQFIWPQAIYARSTMVARSGQAPLPNVAVTANRLQLRLPVGLTVSSDRRRIWDVGLQVAVGPEFSRYSALTYSVDTQQGHKRLNLPAQSWQFDGFVTAAPKIRWRLAQHFALSVGPRVTVTFRGSSAYAMEAGLEVPLSAGPSF